jgi:hypothetical protein
MMQPIIHCNITEQSGECDDRQCVCHVVCPTPDIQRYSERWQKHAQRQLEYARDTFHMSSKPRDFILRLIKEETRSGENFHQTCSVSKITVESAGDCRWQATLENEGHLTIFKIELEVSVQTRRDDGTYDNFTGFLDWIIAFNLLLGDMPFALQLHEGMYRPA